MNTTPTEAPSTVRDAAQALLKAVDLIHDTESGPRKYRVPYGAVNDLRAALAAYTVPAAEAPKPSEPPKEFWDLMHEWAECKTQDRIEWIEHRFGELWRLAATPPTEPSAPDDVLEALDLPPASFRTEGGSINRGKLRAAITSPRDYLPDGHWLVLKERGATEPSSDTPRPVQPAEGGTPREMPAYGYIPWQELIDAVSEAQIGRPGLWKPQEGCYVGHAPVSMNMNSLNRIVSMFASPPPEAQAPSEPDEKLIERMQSAIEGECDGLAIDKRQARAILEYVLDAALKGEAP